MITGAIVAILLVGFFIWSARNDIE